MTTMTAMRRCLTLTLAILLSAGLACAADLPLFHTVGEEEREFTPQAPSGQILRERFVRIDFSLLRDGPARHQADAPVRPVLFNLFPGLDLRVFHVRTEFFKTGGTRVWIGRIADAGDSTVFISMTDGVADGAIRTASGDNFVIRYAGNGVYALRQVDTDDVRSASVVPPPDQVSMPRPDLQVQPDNGERIDLMVVYTQAAVNYAGGLSAMMSRVATAVAETNLGYANSGVTQRLRLVYQGLVNYDESGGFAKALSDVAGGAIDNVHGLRDVYAADIVSLWIANTEYCGLSYQMTKTNTDFAPYAYAVLSVQCTQPYALAHELGHIQGCQHDRANTTQEPVFPYAYGYQYTQEPRFRTIMSEDCSGQTCTRINYWSNPNVKYETIPTGIAATAVNAADNRLSLNNTRAIAANWRKSTFAGTSLIWYNTSDGRCKAWHYAYSTVRSISTYTTLDPVWKIAGTGDFNGDGQSDILWRHSTSGENLIWLMNNGAITAVATTQIADLNWKVQATGDFNADGKTDILWRNTTTGFNRVWYMDGANRNAVDFTAITDTNWAFAAAADFNGDGKTDVVLRNYISGENLIWYLDGIRIAGSAALTGVGVDAWRIVGATDFNGDGIPDIIWRNTENGKNSVWLMKDDLTHTTQWLTQVPNSNWMIGGAGTF